MKSQQKRTELVTRPVKVQYKGTPIIERYQQPPGYENLTTFFYNFAIPQKELVSEEYLIYDGIAMIGVIGGTLGLCIGFSFSDLFRFLFRYLFKCDFKLRQPTEEIYDLAQSNNDKMQTEIDLLKSFVDKIDMRLRKLEGD